MNYEVFTIGGGRFLYNFFGAVAAICQSSQFQSATAAAMLIAMIWVLFVLAFRPTQWDSLKTWLASSFIIIGLMLTPKATVKITDRINPVGSSGYIVANVPVGLAAFAGMTSKIGDEMTRMLETNMADVDSPKLRDHGFMFGVRLLTNATRMEVKDADFSKSLSAYIRNCLFYDIMLGRKSLDDLKAAPDPWTYMTSNASIARMFVVETPVGGGPPIIKTCRAGVADLNAQWNAEIQSATRRLTLFSRPEDIRNNAGAPGRGGSWSEARVNVVMGHVQNDLQSFHRFLIGASRSSADILKRQMTINAIINEPLNWNAELGNAAAVQSYIDARLALQTRQSYRGLARQAEQWVPNLKAVFQGIYYGIFPIAFLMMLSPMGVVIVRNYFFGFVWIESWGPLYAIINYFVNSNAQDRMTAVVNAAAPGGAGDIQLIAQAGIQAVESDIAVQAGYLSMSVPFIAIALAAGAGRFAMLATSTLAVSQDAVSDTTRESATGNFSIGNTSHDSHAFHNRSGFTHNTSAIWDSDYSSARTAEGGMAWQTPDGRVGYHHSGGHSTLAGGVNWNESISEAHTDALHDARSLANTARGNFERATTAASSSYDSFASTLLDGHSVAENFATSERDSVTTNVNTVLDYMKEHGIGKDLNDEQKLAAALSVGIGSEGLLKASGNASYNVAATDLQSHFEKDRTTESARVSEALDSIRSAELSTSSAFRFDKSDSFGEGMEARLNEIRGFSETESTELARARRIEDSLARTETEGGGVNADYTQAFVQWFLDTDQGPVSMLQPGTAEEVAQLQDLQRRFLNEQVLPGHLGVWITPDLEDQFKSQSAELEDRADVPGTHADNVNRVPDGGHIENEMKTKTTELGQEMDGIRSEVAGGQDTTRGDVETNQARVQGAVEDQQDQTKVGRTVEGGITEGSEALHHLLNPDETPENPDDWVFRQQGLSGRRDQADL